MDDKVQPLPEDFFLRSICDVKTTNTPAKQSSSQVTVKTELQVLHLTNDSQQMVMETLRFIHGQSFKLGDSSKYTDRGVKMKKSYWEDRGTLIVQSVSNFSEPLNRVDRPEDRLQRFAVSKLESYGFPTSHCTEALQHCEWRTDDALNLLFTKYMKVPDGDNTYPSNVNEDTIIELRNDEKMALKSIYDSSFEEKENNHIWSLKFKIDHLLKFSPKEEKKRNKTKEVQNNVTTKQTKPMCRNFVKGHCRFGTNCRFSHVIENPETNSDKISNTSEKDEEMWFFLEIRFPQMNKYPYDPPFIFLKTTCHDIPKYALLKITRKLYREACIMASDGMPSVYSICEQLQMDENLFHEIANDNERFVDATKSLFYEGDAIENEVIHSLKSLPTHYEKGRTGISDGFSRTTNQVLKDDQTIISSFLELQTNEKYKEMMTIRKKLPANEKKTEILNLIASNPVVVISGETGCGKSTQVPQFILDNWLLESAKLRKTSNPTHVEIICTQPRRLSAIGVAERVADERVERIGQTIGYQIRLENKISAMTRLTFCTTGILLRRLSSDPFLSSVSHVIIDEVHERSVESDFLLLILKDILKSRRDLKVILMSATLNADLFSNYFGGAPVLDIPGRTFPVEQLFLEDAVELCNYVLECDSVYSKKINKKEEQLIAELEFSDVLSSSTPPPNNIKDENLNLSSFYARYPDSSRTTCKTIYLMEPMKINPDLIESVLLYIVEGNHQWPTLGSILIFLPGLQEIQVVHDALCDSRTFNPKTGKFLLIPLHSTLSSEEQSIVFRPAPGGRRKIILSTNIAETSVTIDDCVFVVDCGLMKETRFDSNRNMESLELIWESRANAMQRKGRAGRVMSGICIHLFTSHRFRHNLISQPVPEIHRVPLEQLILRIKILPTFDTRTISNVLEQTLEPPTEANILSAVERLKNVGALDKDQELTPLGHHLSALPVDVRIGKLMLFGAIFQCLDSVLTIAACLAHKSPFLSPFQKRSEADKKKRSFSLCHSDHLTSLLAYKKWLEVYKRSRLAGRNYADENFLCVKSLLIISEIKYQFLELLVSIGFVPIDVPKKRKNCEDNILNLTGPDLNMNGENNRLLISLLCAALYPNIAKVLTPEKTYIQTAGGAMPKVANAKDIRFKTRLDGYVSIHPSSVNSNLEHFQSPFLVFQEKVKTSKIYIRECSVVPIIPLVLFVGSDLRIELHDGDFLILLEDGWIILKAHNHETAEMVHCLHMELMKLLEEKIKDPCLNLLHHENGRKIIQTIIHLVLK